MKRLIRSRPAAARPERRARRALICASGVLAVVVALTGLAPVSGAEGDTDQSLLAAEAARIVPFEAEASDGTVLRGHVFLPAHEQGEPLATILNMSPYWNAKTGRESEDPRNVTKGDYARFLQEGFAVALVNLRGTGESDGCFQFGGEADRRDVTTVIQSLAHQPWSNGNVGMYGISYHGWTQFMALAKAPPALKAVVPMSGIIDMWSVLTRRGAPIHIGVAAPASVNLLYSQNTSENQRVPGHAACPQTVPDEATHAELLVSGDRNEYWEERDLRDEIQGTRVPVFATNGMKPFTPLNGGDTDAEGHMLQFEGLWQLLRPDRSRLMLGQWRHDTPVDYRSDFLDLVVDWFDHYLRGAPKRTQTGIVEYQDSSGAWHTSHRWPPRARQQALEFSAGALGANPPRSSTTTFQSADIDPGYRCGPHQALYVSPPLREDVSIAGNFTLDTTLTSTLPGGNLVVNLLQSPASGETCEELTAGIQQVGRVQLDLRHWKTPGASQPFPVGQQTRVTVPSEPFAELIPAGHRLVLALGGGSLNLAPDPLKPLLTVTTGPDLASSVKLPVVEGELEFSR